MKLEDSELFQILQTLKYLIEYSTGGNPMIRLSGETHVLLKLMT